MGWNSKQNKHVMATFFTLLENLQQNVTEQIYQILTDMVETKIRLSLDANMLADIRRDRIRN